MAKYNDGLKKDYTSSQNPTSGMGNNKPMATKSMSQVPNASRTLATGKPKKSLKEAISNAYSKVASTVNKTRNNALNRSVSTVSSNIDNKEVQGKKMTFRSGDRNLLTRETSGTLKREKEVYKPESGGKRVVKTSYNKMGDVTKRSVKDTGVNPSNTKLNINKIKSNISNVKSDLQSKRIERAENRLNRLKSKKQ